MIVYTGENTFGYYMTFYELLKDLGINQWHHLTVTLYYSQINLYLDGLLYYSKYIDQYQYRMYANAIIVGQEQDDIGGGFESNEAWDGKISDIRIFNTALNAQEVKMLHLYTSTYEFTEYPCGVDFCSGCYYNTQLCTSCVSGDRILNDYYECKCPDGTLDNSQASCPM
ncbi:Insulin-like growth factor binding protein, N-terminal [Pseudocohnilembus persalinus]|uniref:Insulin-like growth factor binding protein, N-terminal n=1 Tax=Pseudocohnilembus persalinus TaxID=266149 RepID=A0A0V0QH67_PSEPJ|nr:Insulin-like growth factor binding protein, N-terminal [Pseudocohnilembus persalinus]|eukprot:KRX01559.1 Insulin-like growth factor binding protein, N-terminal [Pseudocohnilembus persalinus]